MQYNVSSEQIIPGSLLYTVCTSQSTENLVCLQCALDRVRGAVSSVKCDLNRYVQDICSVQSALQIYM